MKNRPARRYRAGASWKTRRNGPATRARSLQYSATSAWVLKTLVGETRPGEVIAPFGAMRLSASVKSFAGGLAVE